MRFVVLAGPVILGSILGLVISTSILITKGLVFKAEIMLMAMMSVVFVLLQLDQKSTIKTQIRYSWPIVGGIGMGAFLAALTHTFSWQGHLNPQFSMRFGLLTLVGCLIGSVVQFGVKWITSRS